MNESDRGAIMATWLHFVGRGAYGTVNQFAKEVQRHGIQRGVSIAQMKALSWGDRVVLAMQQNDGRTLAFGFFFISTVACAAQVAGIIAEEFPLTRIKQAANGGQVVEGTSGSYMLGPSFTMVDAPSLAQLAQRLTSKDKPFIGGSLVRAKPVILLDHKVGVGFLPFDFRAMNLAAEASDDDALPVIAGRLQPVFDCDQLGAEIAEKGIIQLENYRRNKTS